jgi:hypothetical protein
VYRKFSNYLLFGGAGLVGMAVARRIARELEPQQVVIASLTQAEARAACDELVREWPGVRWVPESGNLFVPTAFAALGRGEILADASRRLQMLDFIFGDFEAAYARNHMAELIRRQRPDAIVDCVNTATGISYQDIFESTATLRDDLAKLAAGDGAAPRDLPVDLETALLSQPMPQIIRHVRFLYRATVDAGTAVYVKVGTTGTGGMGLNIPYTHSEDRPSQTLLTKNAVAFAHTGLLFLLARTPGAPAIKEIKPAAMIGYKAVRVRDIPGKDGKPRPIYAPREQDWTRIDELETREDPSTYEATGDALRLTVVDTGENGLFALGEFGAITALQQMEFVTPEEIARRVVMEMSGASTGNDVIAALDGSVMTSSYRAGLLRNVAMKDLQRIEREHGVPSIALGDLGPPELSKLLFEAWLLREEFGDEVLGSVHDEKGAPMAPESLAERLAARVRDSEVGRQAVSIGIPILLPDGRRLLRGPVVKVPEIKGKRKVAKLGDPAELDRWARRGWIDLRPANMRRWQERFLRMAAARQELAERGSAAVSRETYLPLALKIGDVVAWIFNNEMGGYRVK